MLVEFGAPYPAGRWLKEVPLVRGFSGDERPGFLVQLSASAGAVQRGVDRSYFFLRLRGPSHVQLLDTDGSRVKGENLSSTRLRARQSCGPIAHAWWFNEWCWWY